MSPPAQVNFRTRTGQARRARTHARILSAAFALFDERGVKNVTVEDVRAAAGLARGSFYNYYLTFEEMLTELAARISRQINLEQSANFDSVANPAERLWCRVRYFILRTASDRACSEILVRITPLVESLNEHMGKHAERDLRKALDRKAADVPNVRVALDLGYGLGAMMIRRAMDSKLDAKELEAAGIMLLRAFGIPDREARRIAKLPTPALPQQSLRTAVIGTEPEPASVRRRARA